MQVGLEQRNDNPSVQLSSVAVRGALILFGIATVLSYAYLAYVGLFIDRGHIIRLVIVPMTILVPLVLGWLILRQYPRHTIGWLFLVMAGATMLQLIAEAVEYLNEMHPASTNLWIGAIGHNLEEIAWIPGVFIPLLVLPFLFPNGKLLGPIWRIPVLIAVANLIWMIVAILLHPWPWPYMGVYDTRMPNGIPALEAELEAVTRVLNYLMLPLIILIPAALFVRYRRATVVEKYQIKWPLAATVLFFAYALLVTFVPPVSAWDKEYSYVLTWTATMLFPISVGVAILRYRLFDIDILINRALVYGMLTALIVGLYIAIISGLGHLIQGQTNLISGLIATAVVAVIFQPLRDWLQRGVNRILYDKRDDPVAVIAELAHQLVNTEFPSPILPNLLQTIAETLKIPYVAIWPAPAQASRGAVMEWGKPTAEMETIPLVYQKQTVGFLKVGQRGAGERFVGNERALLTAIAALTATAYQAVQLSDELRQSRQRIVSAREEERRRIRRDLYDGLGPQLASQTLSLEATAQLIPKDPDKALAVLQALQAQSQEAIEDVRRLVYDLRPPALDDFGLEGAVRQMAARYMSGQVALIIESQELPEQLPAAVETAVFRIVQEALTNVIRHADAARCTIRLYCSENEMIVEIEDDGRGIPATIRSGVGLQAMRERAAELRGETTVVRLPGAGTLVRASFPMELYDE